MLRAAQMKLWERCEALDLREVALKPYLIQVISKRIVEELNAFCGNHLCFHNVEVSADGKAISFGAESYITILPVYTFRVTFTDANGQKQTFYRADYSRFEPGTWQEVQCKKAMTKLFTFPRFSQLVELMYSYMHTAHWMMEEEPELHIVRELLLSQYQKNTSSIFYKDLKCRLGRRKKE